MHKQNVYNEVLLIVNNAEHEKAKRQMIKTAQMQTKQEQLGFKEKDLGKIVKAKKLESDLHIFYNK